MCFCSVLALSAPRTFPLHRHGLQKSPLLCYCSSLISSPDTATFWHREPADKRPPCHGPETPINHHHSLYLPKNTIPIMSLLACLRAHLHCPGVDLHIPVFPNPWFCFGRELKKLTLSCSYQNPPPQDSTDSKSLVWETQANDSTMKRLSGVITAVQHRALSSKRWGTPAKYLWIAVWQQSMRQTGTISQVSQGFHCHRDLLAFASPFYLKSL